PARRRVERREQLVGGIHVAVDERVEERRLACVGVADQRDAERLVLLACTPLRAALALDALELLANALDALADHAAIELDLCFARAAARADAAALPLEVAPAAHQSRREVLQPRQVDLELAFVAARALAEDLEDEHRANDNGATEVALEVALLRRRQRLVEDDDLGL